MTLTSSKTRLPCGARVVEEDQIEAVALDVQRRSRVAEVAEAHLTDHAVPDDSAARLLDEAVALDRRVHARELAVLPEVRDQALADVVPGVPRLLEQHDVVALLGEQGGRGAPGRAPADDDDVAARREVHLARLGERARLASRRRVSASARSDAKLLGMISSSSTTTPSASSRNKTSCITPIESMIALGEEPVVEPHRRSLPVRGELRDDERQQPLLDLALGHPATAADSSSASIAAPSSAGSRMRRTARIVGGATPPRPPSSFPRGRHR